MLKSSATSQCFTVWLILLNVLASVFASNPTVTELFTEGDAYCHGVPGSPGCEYGRRRPNFIFLITDDQELIPGGTAGMHYTLPMMHQYGASLENVFANTPICCPSRATLFTGRYAHNWHVPSDDACMYMKVASPEFGQSNIGVYMQSLGYTMGCFGKTLNLEIGTPYCNVQTAMPFPGWNSSVCLCNEFTFYNNLWNVNGTILFTGDKTEEYMTAVIGNHTMKFLENSLQSGKPFFTYIGAHAPHLPSTPAPWYKHELNNLTVPRMPNYNFHGATHHHIVRMQQPLTEETKKEIDELYRNRARSILSVDDIMRSTVDILKKYNQLDNTYIVWTSDHGYQLGQFRIPIEKQMPYDHHIRIPFYIRGPGIQPHVNHSFVASIVDMLPTLLELAGGEVPETMDGHSFASQLLSNETGTRDKHLIEYWSIAGENYSYLDHLIDMPNNTFIGVRLLNSTHNYLYVEYYANKYEEVFDQALEYELFNMSEDPWQMWNLYGTPEAEQEGPLKVIIAELQEFLHQQVKCRGYKQCL